MTTATSIVPTARSGSTGKIVSAREAVLLIRSGETVAISGFGGIGFAEEVVNELAAVYKASDQELASFGRPSGLTLMFGVGQGQPFPGQHSRSQWRRTTTASCSFETWRVSISMVCKKWVSASFTE